MEPFVINISDETLDDLRHRLGQTRWPDEMPGVGWDYGSNLAYIRELVEYWRTEFDWRVQGKEAQRFPALQVGGGRAGHSFHPGEGDGAEPDAAGDYARLAQHFL